MCIIVILPSLLSRSSQEVVAQAGRHNDIDWSGFSIRRDAEDASEKKGKKLVFKSAVTKDQRNSVSEENTCAQPHSSHTPVANYQELPSGREGELCILKDKSNIIEEKNIIDLSLLSSPKVVSKSS